MLQAETSNFTIRLRSLLLIAAAAVGFGLSCVSSAATIGQWVGSTRSWNSSQMSTLKATLEAAGHIVQADGAIPGSVFSGGFHIYVIGEPASSPTAAELATLAAFVQGGGTLIVLGDVGLNPTFVNSILSGVGSNLVFAPTGASNTPLASGSYATQGPPYSIVGQTLTVTTGASVSGGTVLAGSYVHVQALGAGTVFAFGDRIDHNALSPTDTSPNGQIFLNIAAGAQIAANNLFVIPTLSHWGWLVLMLLLGTAAWRVSFDRSSSGKSPTPGNR